MRRPCLLSFLVLVSCQGKPDPENVLVPSGYGSKFEILMLPGTYFAGDTPPLKLSGGTYTVRASPKPRNEYPITPEDFLGCESIVTLVPYGQRDSVKAFSPTTTVFKTVWSGIPKGIYALKIESTSVTPCPLSISFERLGG